MANDSFKITEFNRLMQVIEKSENYNELSDNMIECSLTHLTGYLMKESAVERIKPFNGQKLQR